MDKSELRRHFRRQRRLHLPLAEPGIVSVATREVAGLLSGERHLGLYWPLAHEPDLRALTRLFPWKLALPAVRQEAGLVYLPWQVEQPLRPDACGVPAPIDVQPLPPEAIDLLLVPALAVSPDGLRLGSGGGWFDRLRANPRWRAIPSLAVLPAACLSPFLPRDPWDVPFAGWLDESGIHPAQSKEETFQILNTSA